jgi:hypothetical protein
MELHVIMQGTVNIGGSFWSITMQANENLNDNNRMPHWPSTLYMFTIHYKWVVEAIIFIIWSCTCTSLAASIVACHFLKSLQVTWQVQKCKTPHRSWCIVVTYIYHEPPMVVGIKFHHIMINKSTWSWCPNDFLSMNRSAPKCVQQPSKVVLHYKQ